MAFESLTEKLQKVFRDIRGKGKLSEADVKAALKEVRMALLEADVGFKVVKQFIKSIENRAVGAEVMESLTPGQQVVKIVNEELISLMGSETTSVTMNQEADVTVILMAGLQGAGKTTTAAKLAGKLKAKGIRPLLAACDVYRPAAVEQLKVNGERVGVPVFSMGTGQNPVNIARAALASARQNQNDLLKRVDQQLQGYEEKLKLVRKFREQRERIRRIRDISEGILLSRDPGGAEEIRELTEKLLEES